MPTTEETTNKTKPTEETGTQKRTRSNSFANLLQKGTNMASGIGAHLETLSPRGINEETIQELDRLVETSTTMDNDQEILKGQLKEKTASLRENTGQLKQLLSECTLIVKAVVQQERWVDFGITAKK